MGPAQVYVVSVRAPHLLSGPHLPMYWPLPKVLNPQIFLALQSLKPCNFNGFSCCHIKNLTFPNPDMIFRINLRSDQIRTLLGLHKSFHHLKRPSHCDRTKPQINLTFSHDYFVPISIFQRPISISSQFEDKIDSESVSSDNIQGMNKKTRKPLVVLFKEAVGLSQRLEENERESGSDNDTKELKQKLRKLEIEVRDLNENKKKIEVNETRVSTPGNLSALFSSNSEKKESKSKREEEDVTVYKKLPSDMALFADHLYRRGYFEKANFCKRGSFDVTCFEGSYARNFLRFAVEKFAKENQQITQWLSSSDLKTVAQFGCPSLGRKTVFSAKALRVIFKIKEDMVCSKCVLNKKCKFVNQSVWKSGSKNLDLAGILRVISLYGLESVPAELVIPEEVKNSVSQLLKDILHQSQNVG